MIKPIKLPICRSEYWRGKALMERCWVPWDWCTTVKQQTQNNSIVILSPSFDTIHAVKASYCHLEGQRTQLYGNLWYKEGKKQRFISSNRRLDWWDFDFKDAPAQSLLTRVKKNYSSKKKKLFRQ